MSDRKLNAAPVFLMIRQVNNAGIMSDDFARCDIQRDKVLAIWSSMTMSAAIRK
jgi:hypothetical protein